MNWGMREAGIQISSLVLGLRPVRPSRVLTSKLPKPTRETFSPAMSSAVMASIVAVMTLSVSFLDSPAS